MSLIQLGNGYFRRTVITPVLVLLEKEVFGCLSDEWQTVTEVSIKRGGGFRREIALALMRLHARGEIDWKPFPKTLYRLKQQHGNDPKL